MGFAGGRTVEASVLMGVRVPREAKGPALPRVGDARSVRKELAALSGLGEAAGDAAMRMGVSVIQCHHPKIHHFPLFMRLCCSCYSA